MNQSDNRPTSKPPRLPRPGRRNRRTPRASTGQDAGEPVAGLAAQSADGGEHLSRLPRPHRHVVGEPGLHMFYNGAASPALGVTKHPGWLGRSGANVWSEIWPTSADAGRRLSDPRSHLVGGLAARSAPATSPMENYFTFSYSPIRDDTGALGGILLAVTERRRVIGERRLALSVTWAAP